MVGTSVSHYRITAKLGAGGMGVVYRAEDTNLGRQVAIKVLPEMFSGDPERMARFEREARLLASLNHPNIAAIYGLESVESLRFLVLELIEGETLADRIARGPLPVDEGLDVCRQITEGLEAAHEKGIIHRDLKPANVKVAPDGRVKILDFGLARALQDQAPAADQSHSPTITADMTRPGVVLGTAAYMSPEQAKGRAVDKRADIWAFGCVLYECLTGKAPFKGDTVTETMAKILEGAPDWSALPAETPSMVRSLLRQCLQKDPARRLHEIADARIEIAEAAVQPPAAAPSSGRFSGRLVLAGMALALVAGASVTAALLWRYRPAGSSPVVRSIVRIAQGQWLSGMARAPEFWRPSRTAMAISGDGQFIVYSAVDGIPSLQAVPRLYLRRMDQVEPTAIAGTEGAIGPFLSPDDRWVGFWANGRLAKVPIEGGVPAILCEAAEPFGASWGTDNRIVFSPGPLAGLFRVSADGGKPEALVSPENPQRESSYRLPHYLPDGQRVLFTVTREQWDTRPAVALLDLASRTRRILIEDAADARYIPTGHVVFLRQGTLMVVPFDPGRLDTAASPAPVVADILQAINSTHSHYNTCGGQFGVSASGALAYVKGGIVPDMENALVWVDRRGVAQPAAPAKAPYIWPRLSPDGRRIAYAALGREWRVRVHDLGSGTAIDLDGGGKSNCATWTRDGKRVIFQWRESGRPNHNIYWQAADASSPMERLTTSDDADWPGSLAPDGNTLAFVRNSDILLLDLKSLRLTPFIESQFAELYPAFSPDGRWLAYTSNESGREEVYVRSYPDPGRRWKISLDGGTEPLWARNGRELFFRWQDQVWAADIDAGDVLLAGRPRLLFEKPGYRMTSPLGCWDVSPDGQRFLMVQLDERKANPINEMILVQNWFEEVRRLVPGGKQ